MQRLSRDGVPPADAARVALGTPVAVPPAAGTGSARQPGGPGGRVLAVGGASPSARGLGRAAMALDAAAMTQQIRRAVETYGVLATWEQLLRPVLAAAGERWAATGEGVDVEHLLSDCIVGVLREVTATATPRRVRPVLLAAAPAEQHAVPLFALAAALAEIGVGCHQLGAAVPDEALHSAVRRIGPAVLFVWSQLTTTADPAALAGLPVTRPPTAILVGGPGWAGADLPERVAVADSLPAAIRFVAAELGSDAGAAGRD